MSFAIDPMDNEIDGDADYYEKVIRPRYVERVRCISGLFPELSVEDLQKIEGEIERLDIKKLREKLNKMARNKTRTNQKGR